MSSMNRLPRARLDAAAHRAAETGANRPDRPPRRRGDAESPSDQETMRPMRI